MPADALKKAGVTVDLQSMDWSTVITRRNTREAPSANKSGWDLAFNRRLKLCDEGDDRRRSRTSALAYLEWQREERPAQHQPDPQGHACLHG
jgi:ABC-type transport system substrate-binding protein